MSSFKPNLNTAIASIIAFVSIMLTIIYGAIGFYEHRLTVNTLTIELFKEQQRTITAELEHKFNIQSQLGRLAASSIPAVYDQSGRDGVEQYLFNNLSIFEEVAALFFTDSNDDFYGYIKQDDLLHMYSNSDTGFTILFNQVDPNNSKSTLVNSTPGFYATKRPWYLAALSESTQGFNNIFTYHAYSTLALPHSLPVYKDNGELLGVFGSNIFLGEFGGFLKEQVRSFNGVAVILDNRDNVVASSLDVSPIMQLENRSEMISAAESDSQYIQNAMDKVPLFDSIGDEPNELPLLQIDDKNYLVSSFVFNQIPNLNWKISLYIPEQQYHQNVARYVSQMALFMLIVLVISLFLSIFVSRLISNPISAIVGRFSNLDVIGKAPKPDAGGSFELQEVAVLKSAAHSYNKQIFETLNSLQTKISENKEQLYHIKKLAVVSQSIDDMSLILTKSGLVDWGNLPFWAFFDLDAHKLEGTKLDGLVVKDEGKARLMDDIKALVRQCLCNPNEKLERKSSQKSHHYELRCYPINADDHEGNILIMIQDVSVQRAYEQELVVWRQVFESTVSGIAISYQNNEFIDVVNPAFAKIYGGTVEQYVGADISMFYPPDQQHMPDKMRALANEKGEFTVETEHMRRNGDIFPALLSVTFVRDKHKEILARVAMITDLTDIKQMQQELFQSQKMHAIGSLAGGIVHDMNNILGAVIGNAEMGELINQNTLDETSAKNTKYFQSVLKAARRGSKLTQQILAFTRMETMERRDVNLRALITETVELVSATKPKNIRITEEYSLPESAYIYGNESQLQQVLLNLVNNAVKAIVKTSKRDGEIRVNAFTNDVEELVISVKDNGCGIAQDSLPFVFDPFFTTEVKGKGTGLGLAIVKRIISAHEGDIQVTSEAGEGTCFTLSFQNFGLQKRDSGQDNLLAEELNNDKYVVLVDDDVELLDVWKELFEMQGFMVNAFNNPIEAKAYCLNNLQSIDCLVTDYNMPGMTGEQLIMAIREHSDDLNIIMATGFSESMNQERVSALNVNKLMFKPVVFSELLAEVLKLGASKIATPKNSH